MFGEARLDLADRCGLPAFFLKKMLAAILPLISLLIFLPRGRERPSQKSLLTVGADEIFSALLKLESEMPS